LLAVVESLKTFHYYLYERKFQIRTDYILLRWLISFRNLKGQMARWNAYSNMISRLSIELEKCMGMLMHYLDALALKVFVCMYV